MANFPLSQEAKDQRALMARRAAELHVEGIGEIKAVSVIAQEFDLTFTRHKLKALRTHPEYRKFVTAYEEAKVEYANSQIALAKAKVQLGVMAAVPELIAMLTTKIKEGDTKVIMPVLKIMGFDNEETDNKQAQQLTVVMPGAKAPKIIDIAKDDSDDK